MSVKVSIVVPFYNAEKYLQNTVELLIAQTLKDIEIILIDDGSTDSSPAICDALARNNDKVVCLHIKNEGVSNARNKGIEIAKGDYIGFCDADDLPDKTLYETLYNLAEDNCCELSVVKYTTIFDDGKIMNNNNSGEITVYNNKDEALIDFFKVKIQSGVYTKLLKRNLCKKISFEKGRNINEDRMFVFEALCNADSCVYKDISLYKYIRRAGSLSNCSFSEKFFDIKYFADKMVSVVSVNFPQIINYAKGNNIYSSLEILKIMCITHCVNEYVDQYNSLAKEVRKADFKVCKNYLSRNSFIKWLALKINKNLFKLLVIKFGRT